jgi:HTH-type transcriptional regulator/antitoxin HigA
MSQFAEVKALAQTLDKKLPFLHGIDSPEQHNMALELMEELIEDYDTNIFLIDALYAVIERYEDDAPEFEEFNADIESLNSGIAVLNVLMDQHNLKTDDFKNEIGGKSMVSMIMNGKRKLSLEHIYKLAERFSISPRLFV